MKGSDMDHPTQHDEPDGDERHDHIDDDSPAEGDAAAGSVEEREALARDEDATWDSDS